jgi:hypothetical protein
LASAAALVGAGQLTVGAVVSLTVNVVVHVLVFPDPSVAVRVIVFDPWPTIVPAAGLCVTVTGPQLSEVVAPDLTSGIGAWQLASADALVGAGQVIAGASLSFTVTVWLHDELLPELSVAVQ